MRNTAAVVQLGRVQAQIHEIVLLLEEPTPCVDAICRIRAAQRTLHPIALDLLEYHLGSCIAAMANAQDVSDCQALFVEIQELFCWINRIAVAK